MSPDASLEADLSDEWIEREQPPTLKLSNHGSLSGSVNILGDTTQKWNNLNKIVSKDLLTKQTKPLTSLFEPPPGIQAQLEGLSIVEEEHSEEEQELMLPQDYTKNIPDHKDSSWNLDLYNLEDREESDSATIRAGHTMRSADGLIPNFSFPRNGQQSSVQPDLNAAESRIDYATKNSPEPLTTLEATDDPEMKEHNRNTDSGAPLVTTPKNTHKSSNSSTSPTKSPLKLFHAEQDTFTRDHTARMIGMLSAPQDPTVQLNPDDDVHSDREPIKSHVSTLTETIDGGPERKRVKTHEPKGSVTLQNFNDNADRLAAKLRAKSGILGKGLPRMLEDTKVVLGRRISSAAERLDQQRKRDRNPKFSNVPQTSGFEAMNIPIDQFSRGPTFGTKSSKSHFSDWESETNPESRQVSTAQLAPTSSDEQLAAQSIKPQKMYDSVRQTWTQTPGRIKGSTRPSSAPAMPSPQQHVRHQSNTSVTDSRKSPKLKNFPPTALETLRHGNMIFSTSTQCWQNADESQNENDPFDDIDDIQSPKKLQKETKFQNTEELDYPDEIDFSTSSSPISANPLHNQQQPDEDDSFEGSVLTGPTGTGTDDDLFGTSCRRTCEDPSRVLHGITVESGKDVTKVSQGFDGAYEEDQADQTADMTMSQSTRYLVSAINKRYGEGPWEDLHTVDLSGLALDSLCGLSDFFPDLTVLDISNNKITSLDQLPTSLQILKAGNNRLTSYRTNLGHLPNLEHLFLTGNEFDDLDGLSCLTHLRTLDISHNQLHCIDGLRHLTNLSTLKAAGNKVEGVDFSDLQMNSPLNQLQLIDLSNNNLQSISCIESLPSLMDLNISGNSVSSLDIPVSMPQLRVLKASENDLAVLNLTPLSKLRVLYVDDNQLEEVILPKCLKHIESFSIRRQNSYGLKIDLDSLCEVRKLFLGGNEMSSLHFQTVFHSLKYLELAGTKLQSLPSQLGKMAPNLRVLNCANNDLSEITALSGLQRLERLMLPNNKITSVKGLGEVLAAMPRLKAVDLRGNPYTSRFYAPIRANLEIDYFANMDGMRNTTNLMQEWLMDDDHYLATLNATMKTRRTAYQNLIWTICRALRWHDGRMLETQQLLAAEEYVHTFTEDNISAG